MIIATVLARATPRQLRRAPSDDTLSSWVCQARNTRDACARLQKGGGLHCPGTGFSWRTEPIIRIFVASNIREQRSMHEAP